MKKIDILAAPFVQEMMNTTANLYRLGWDERNGGNIAQINEYAEAKDVTTMISFGGWSNSEHGEFEDATSTPAKLGWRRLAESNGLRRTRRCTPRSQLRNP